MVDSRPGIITPEAVVLEFETAGLGTRIVAKVIDIFLQFVLLLLVQMALTLILVGVINQLPIPEWVPVVASIVLTALIFLAYPAVFEAYWEGRTLGKAAMGLRVVTVEGVPITIRHATIRVALGLIDFFFPIPGGLLGAATALFNSKSQRLGDLVAGTIVLNERSGLHHARAIAFSPVPGWEHFTSTLDVGSLKAPQYALIRSFLLRVSELTPHARASVSQSLATVVSEQLRQPAVDPTRSEPFLICVAAAYQARHAPRAG